MPGKRWISGAVCGFALTLSGCCWWCERHCCAPYQGAACCVPAACCPAPSCAPATCAPAGVPAPAGYPPANTTWQRPQPGCCP